MKNQTTNPFKLGAVTLSSLLAVIATNASAQVALPPNTPETVPPGVAGLPIPANTPGVLSGTVLAAFDSPFADNALPTPFATGILRSFVVDRDPTAGVALDFVYQLVNTSTPPPDITTEFFRLKTVDGFGSFSTDVANTNAFAGLTAGPGSGFNAGSYTQGAALKPAASADRDVGTLGSVGFDFPVQPPAPFIGDPRNIGQGQSSSFLVVRTNATTFNSVAVQISGAATGTAFGFAPIPEPGTVCFGLAVLGFCATRFGSRRKQLEQA